MYTLPIATSSFQNYLDSIQKIPILTGTEERQLVESYQQNDDIDAAHKLVISNLRFVVHMARKYDGYGLPLEDLVQEGNYGLMKSLSRFDIDRGFKLISFSVFYIKSAIQEHVIRNWKIVKTATTKPQRKLFFNLRKKAQLSTNVWLTSEETEQMAIDLDVSTKEVTRMEGRLRLPNISFDALEGDDNVELRSLTPSEYLATGKDTDPAEQIAAMNYSENLHKSLSEAMGSLNERAQDIITSRFLSEDKVSFRELSEKYGVSIQRIQQIEVETLKKMKPHFDLLVA